MTQSLATSRCRDIAGKISTVLITSQAPLKKKRWNVRKLYSQVSFALGFGIVSTFSAIPAFGAERISFFYPPFGQFSVSIQDLEIFAKEGKITPNFAFYAKRVKPEQLAALRESLSQRFDVSPLTVYRFTHSPIGETILNRLGLDLKADVEQNGFYSLRAALYDAASDPQGLTIINVLHYFPSATIWLDINRSQQVVAEISKLLKQKDLVIAAIQHQAAATAQPSGNFRSDLRLKGPLKWRSQTLTFTNPQRPAPSTVTADIYLPQGTTGPIPLIVISHGIASDRKTFAYLAQHLASWGMAAVALEHPDTNGEAFEQFFAGFDRPPLPTAFVNRPLDVKYLLDTLQQKAQSDPAEFGQLNLQQVGAIGQSMGGYTVLALGGAPLELKNLGQKCEQLKTNLSFDLSLLLQCRATDLPSATYNLRDERVKAVLAVNPIGSEIFGEQGQGVSLIQVPLMVVSGSNDVFAPPLEEQIFPFTKLTTPNKYLVVLQNGTHFSFLGGEGKGVLPVPPELIGPDPALARPELSALSTAFFKVYLGNQGEYRSYLSESYVKSISASPFNLNLVQSWTAAQLKEALTSKAPKNNTSPQSERR